MSSGVISIVKAREERAAAVQRVKAPGQAVAKRVGLLAAGAVFGHFEKSGKLPVSVNLFGLQLPTKALVAVVGHVAAAKTHGDVQKVANATADAAAVLQGYASGRAGQLVAG